LGVVVVVVVFFFLWCRGKPGTAWPSTVGPPAGSLRSWENLPAGTGAGAGAGAEAGAEAKVGTGGEGGETAEAAWEREQQLRSSLKFAAQGRRR